MPFLRLKIERVCLQDYWSLPKEGILWFGHCYRFHHEKHQLQERRATCVRYHHDAIRGSRHYGIHHGVCFVGACQEPRGTTEAPGGVEQNRKEATAPYLKAVLNETMRLHPASPLSAIKQVKRDFISKDGYSIPTGTIIFMGLVALSRDPSLYPNPCDFQPSRWLNPTTEDAKKAFFPFSLGNRNCVGQPLANAQLHSVLPRLIQEFSFTVEEEGTIEAQGTLRLNGCLLKATKVTALP